MLLRSDAQLVVEGVVPNLLLITKSLKGHKDGNLTKVRGRLAEWCKQPTQLQLEELASHAWQASMSSQLVTIPCSMGYFRVSTPRLLCASSPT